MRMKIVLFALNSSYSHTNLAVRCIRRSLTNAGFDARILEFNLKDRRGEILGALVGAEADIYGFSAYIWNIRELLAYASDLKKLKPTARIVFGGPEVSYNAPELLRAHSFIDNIITGEGEAAFVGLAEAHLRGGEPPAIIDGGIYEGFAEAGMLYEPDELDGERRMLYYESSRGCPYRCAYCLSALSGRVRAKSAERTLSELAGFEALSADIKVIKFVDRTFNFDIGRAKEIWRGLRSDRYTKRYHFEICAELLDEESFALLASFPKDKIQLEIGVQSTNPDTLARVSRRTDTNKLLAAIERLHSFGNMHIHADLIAGLPGEDFESFGRSFDALIGRCDMLQLGFLKLLHGSGLRERADEFGCIYSDEPPYTVLATDCLSFSELELLHDIDELCERYVNSGAFRRTITLALGLTDSPFRMLAGLAKDFRESGLRITGLSQPRAFTELYDRLGNMIPAEKLATALTLDFLTGQKTSPPAFGDFALERYDNADRKHDFMRYADENGIGYFAPALELRRGSGREFILDRKNGLAFERLGGGYEIR